MSVELHEYDTVINGMETTLLLTADEAKKRGLVKAESKSAAKPQGKGARSPSNKAAAPAANKATATSTPLGTAALGGSTSSTSDGSAA